MVLIAGGQKNCRGVIEEWMAIMREVITSVWGGLGFEVWGLGVSAERLTAIIGANGITASSTRGFGFGAEVFGLRGG